MPVDVTETVTFPSTVVAPVAGDPRTAASVRTPVERLAQRTRVLLNALSGHIVWSGRLHSDTPVSGTGVFADEIGSIVIGEKLFTPAASYEVPGALSAVAAWRYVYAYNNAGTLALQHSLDAPDASLTWKSTGLGTHRYLGCFRTDASGVVQPFTSTRGRYLYRRSAMSAVTNDLATDGLRALNDSTATGHTLVDLAPALPPHARTALLFAWIDSVATGANAFAQLRVFSTDETSAPSQQCVARTDVTGNNSEATMSVEIEVTADAALSIGYSVVYGSSTGNYFIDVLGFLE